MATAPSRHAPSPRLRRCCRSTSARRWSSSAARASSCSTPTGSEYLDFVSGIAVNALGYGDAGLREAMHAAADGLIHVSNLFRTAPGEQLAARSSSSRSPIACSSATRAPRPTKARSSSRAAGRARVGRREARDRRRARSVPRTAVRHARGDRSPGVSQRRSVRSPAASRSSSATSKRWPAS